MAIDYDAWFIDKDDFEETVSANTLPEAAQKLINGLVEDFGDYLEFDSERYGYGIVRFVDDDIIGAQTVVRDYYFDKYISKREE